MTRVLHIITGLGLGGAEMMLLKLLQASNRSATEHVVLTLTDLDVLGSDIRALGVSVHSLGISGAASGLRGLWAASRLVRSYKPDVVMTWLHHADLFGVMLKCLHPTVPLVWNLRCSKLSPEDLPRSNIVLVRLLARLSFVPSVVVANAHVGMEEHVRVGYKPRRWLVLPNGFDTREFSPDDLARKSIRNQLGIDESDFVVGMVGRYHRMKGFDLFAKAAGIAAQENARLRFVLVGTDVSEDNEELVKMFKAAGIGSRVSLLGQRRDIPAVMNGFDVLANTSTSEGFPNVVGEAMSCGLPCAVTDVGDSGVIVGQTGGVTPSGDAEALAKSWLDFVNMEASDFSSVKASARQRILDFYDISIVAHRYQELFENVAR